MTEETKSGSLSLGETSAAAGAGDGAAAAAAPQAVERSVTWNVRPRPGVLLVLTVLFVDCAG